MWLFRDAIQQYQNDRDPGAELLLRCAVLLILLLMTARLCSARTSRARSRSLDSKLVGSVLL